MPKTAPQFPARVRFNWGFHDGTRDAEQGRFQPGGMLNPNKPHIDPTYEKGYRMGHADFKATGKRTESSQGAWDTRCTCKVPFGWHTDGCRAKAA